jgi:hypothetical protein
MGRAYSTNEGKKRNVYRKMMGKPERKRPPGTSRRKWVDNGKVGWGVMHSIGLDQWRPLVSTEMNT